LIAVIAPLRKAKVQFALVGGMAVSYRTVERFTKDVDLALAVESDEEAERAVRDVREAGYSIEMVLEQTAADRLSTIRMVPLNDKEMFVDLLFASSGIEHEVVASATDAEIAPALAVPVATIPALIALKVLSADWKTRPQDILDLQHLISSAVSTQIDESRHLLDLITERGFNRTKDLQSELDGYIERFAE